MASDKPNLGSKISLIAKAEISCGIIDDTVSTVELAKANKDQVLETPTNFKGNLNITLLGESGHGKSMIAGQLLISADDSIDKRKSFSIYSDAQNKTWCPSWFSDASKGELKKKRFLRTKVLQCGHNINIIDAPPNPKSFDEEAKAMWLGNLFVMVLSAKSDETEKFFYEVSHAKHLENWARYVSKDRAIGFVFALTKMDDESVNWSETRFLEVKERLRQFLPKRKSCEVVPVSGEGGFNVWRRCEESKWYTGRTLVECIKEMSLNVPQKYTDWYKEAEGGLLRFILVDSYKKEKKFFGQVATGHLEKGGLCQMPKEMGKQSSEQGSCHTPKEFKILSIEFNGHNLDKAGPEQMVMLELEMDPKEEHFPQDVIGETVYKYPTIEAVIEVVEGSVIEERWYTLYAHAHSALVSLMNMQVRDKNFFYELSPELTKFVSTGIKAAARINCLTKEVFADFNFNKDRLEKFVLVHDGKVQALGKFVHEDTRAKASGWMRHPLTTMPDMEEENWL